MVACTTAWCCRRAPLLVIAGLGASASDAGSYRCSRTVRAEGAACDRSGRILPRVPFSGLWIMTASGRIRIPGDSGFSEGLHELILRVFSPSPAYRPDAGEVRMHSRGDARSGRSLQPVSSASVVVSSLLEKTQRWRFHALGRPRTGGDDMDCTPLPERGQGNEGFPRLRIMAEHGALRGALRSQGRKLYSEHTPEIEVGRCVACVTQAVLLGARSRSLLPIVGSLLSLSAVI